MAKFYVDLFVEVEAENENQAAIQASEFVAWALRREEPFELFDVVWFDLNDRGDGTMVQEQEED